MIHTSIHKFSEDIGFDIANSDDNVQSQLLNGLGRGFKTYQSHAFSMQLAYLVGKLTPEAKKFITELSEFIKMDDES